MRVEILRAQATPNSNDLILDFMAEAIFADGHEVVHTKQYEGKSDVLMLFGIGFPDHDRARKAHVKSGRRVIHWDLGYFGKASRSPYKRFSIDEDHPQAFLDKTEPKPDRWAEHGIELREDYKFSGPLILIGLGRKSRAYLKLPNWEREKLHYINKRFEGKKVIWRPKGKDTIKLPITTDSTTPIDQLLKGAFRVICRHSNVATDAAIAGVPFEAENGAAVWLLDKPYTPEVRLDYLRRLSFFQWRNDEADEAWKFIKGLL